MSANNDPSFACDECGFEIWHPIARLSQSTLGLYDDRRWPGRCLLVLNEHHDHFEEVTSEIAQEFVSDIRLVGTVLKRLTGAIRVNYALLGNEVSHVHAHLIPRGATSEVVPFRPIWEDPRPPRQLPRREIEYWVAKIRLELRAESSVVQEEACL